MVDSLAFLSLDEVKNTMADLKRNISHGVEDFFDIF